MRAGMILGSMAITLGGVTLTIIIDPIGVGDGEAITPVSTHLGMILGIMVVSTVAIGVATGVATGAVIGGITIIIPLIMRSPCVIMPMDVPDSIGIIRLAAAVA